MSKLTCLVLCVVTVRISSVYAEGRDCIKEHGITEADMKAVMETGDVSKIDPCYWGCFFTAIGLLNDKGEYDVDSYRNNMRKLMRNDDDLAALENFGNQCLSVKDKAVSDGEAGCEMGALMAACFFTPEYLMKIKIPSL